MLHFKKAKGLTKWFLETFNYVAIVSPFTLTAYILDEYFYSYTIRKHETTHYNQMLRNGIFVFCVKYLYYSIRYGYFNNPFEVEARKSERSF